MRNPTLQPFLLKQKKKINMEYQNLINDAFDIRAACETFNGVRQRLQYWADTGSDELNRNAEPNNEYLQPALRRTIVRGQATALDTKEIFYMGPVVLEQQCDRFPNARPATAEELNAHGISTLVLQGVVFAFPKLCELGKTYNIQSILDLRVGVNNRSVTISGESCELAAERPPKTREQLALLTRIPTSFPVRANPPPPPPPPPPLLLLLLLPRGVVMTVQRAMQGIKPRRTKPRSPHFSMTRCGSASWRAWGHWCCW